MTNTTLTHDQIISKLEDTVKQFLDEGRMFTGYDVTLETRNREKIRLRHEDVRGEIHNIPVLQDAMDYGYDSSNGQTVKWFRGQKEMPNNQWAFIYHPANLDPKNYVSVVNNKSSAAAIQSSIAGMSAIASISATDGTVCDSGGDQGDGTFVTDSRKRLLIPKRFLSESGAKPTDQVWVIVDNKNHKVLLIPTRNIPLNASIVSQNPTFIVNTQIVERNGDLRISSQTLTNAQLAGTRFTIENCDFDCNGNIVKAVEIKIA